MHFEILKIRFYVKNHRKFVLIQETMKIGFIFFFLKSCFIFFWARHNNLEHIFRKSMKSGIPSPSNLPFVSIMCSQCVRRLTTVLTDEEASHSSKCYRPTCIHQVGSLRSSKLATADGPMNPHTPLWWCLFEEDNVAIKWNMIYIVNVQSQLQLYFLLGIFSACLHG